MAAAALADDRPDPGHLLGRAPPENVAAASLQLPTDAIEQLNAIASLDVAD